MEKEIIAKASVSMQEILLEAGRRRARADQRSFSNYTARLIAADLVRIGWMKEDGSLTEKGQSMLPQAEVAA